jgi:hypothetical protein
VYDLATILNLIEKHCHQFNCKNMKSHFLLKMIPIWSLLIFSLQKVQAEETSLPASDYSAAVLNKWMSLQIRLMATTPHRLNGPFVRGFSYSGLAAYYSVAPGIPRSSTSWFSADRLNNLPALPKPGSEKFHWPSSLNAALAFMNRSMFPAATAWRRGQQRHFATLSAIRTAGCSTYFGLGRN